mmetsp:Transcript_9522/g.28388  ORF Transcript_9522/g.28388 Transcript_9522/m.28388 type:complete len:607 (+) Transcript_9522:106-1926(+)
MSKQCVKKTSLVTNSCRSNTLIVAFSIFLVVVLAGINPADSFTASQCNPTSGNIDEGKLNRDSARRRRRYQQSKNENRIYASTLLQLSYQPQGDMKPDSNGDTTSATTTDDKKDLTLYEILGAPPTASRSELKRQYVKLARVSHPDAQIGGTEPIENGVDFQQIAEAWRTLGNEKTRKRYDRELKAKEWGEKAQRFTNEGLEQVAPVASKIMDNVAVPFLRRTSATIAFGKNIANGFRSVSPAPPSSSTSTTTSPAPSEKVQTENVDIGTETTEQKIELDAIISGDEVVTSYETSETKEQEITNGVVTTTAVSDQDNPIDIPTSVLTSTDAEVETIFATTDAEENQASQTVEDTPNDLNDESLKLEEQARVEAEKAKHISEELELIKKQRLFATLQSTELTLTSNEAEEVLERLKSDDTVSFVNRGTKKAAIEKEIQSLRNTETQFTENLQTYNQMDREWNVWLNKQEDARQNLLERRKKEIEARKAFDDAQQMVIKAKDDMLSVTNTLRGVEQEVRKSAQEMDRVSTTLSRKQERVQNALRRKTELMKGGIQVEYITEHEVMMLRRKETQLMGESKQIATMVARLQSRADKLKKRAEALEQWRNN